MSRHPPFSDYFFRLILSSFDDEFFHPVFYHYLPDCSTSRQRDARSREGASVTLDPILTRDGIMAD